MGRVVQVVGWISKEVVSAKVPEQVQVPFQKELSVFLAVLRHHHHLCELPE